MKKFILVFEDKIVLKYEDEKPRVYGGPWSQAETFEVPEGVSLELAEVVDGEIVERKPSEDEVYLKEIQESEIYYSQIQKGQRAIALFRLQNDKKGLTDKQKMQLVVDADIQNIVSMLMIGKLPEAAALIEELEADGKLITEADKQKLIRFLGE